MSGLCVGVDPSSKRLAFAGLADDGAVTTAVVPVSDQLRGGQRLRVVREAAVHTLTVSFPAASVIVVEIPWANPKSGSSFVLMSIAGVLLEAAQAACPNAVVLEQATQVWKRDSVGNGNAPKSACMEHARALGLEVADQDLADAVCMAQSAWSAWGRRVEGPSDLVAGGGCA